MKEKAADAPPASRLASALHLDTGRSMRGGQKQVLMLLAGLQRGGWKVTLGARPGPLLEAADARGLPVLPLPLRGEWDLGSAGKIARWVKDNRIDLVHAHDAHAHGIARLSQALGMPAPLIVHRRVNFPLASSILHRWKYLRGVSAYIVVSQAVGKRLENIGVPPASIHRVHSSVDALALERQAQEPLPPGVPEPGEGRTWIACVGALEKEKGQHVLLACLPELAEQYPGLHVLFLGEGRDRGKLERQARSLGIEPRCTFTGFIEPIAPVLVRSTCVILPTFSEGFPPAALEAMALGIPVVASATGGLLEIIDSGDNGLLFDVADPDALKQSLRRLLDDPELGPALGRKAKTKVLGRFSRENMIERTLDVYRQVVPAATG